MLDETKNLKHLLRLAGIPEKSHDWQDYERAKRLLGGRWMEPWHYERAIQIITEYVGV